MEHLVAQGHTACGRNVAGARVKTDDNPPAPSEVRARSVRAERSTDTGSSRTDSGSSGWPIDGATRRGNRGERSASIPSKGTARRDDPHRPRQNRSGRSLHLPPCCRPVAGAGWLHRARRAQPRHGLFARARAARARRRQPRRSWRRGTWMSMIAVSRAAVQVSERAVSRQAPPEVRVESVEGRLESEHRRRERASEPAVACVGIGC